MRPAFTKVEDRHIERRAAGRRRTLLAAKLSFSDAALIVDCRVRNMSSGGALVELVNTTLLKPPFCLLTIRDGAVHEADLVWAWGRLAGFKFTAKHGAEAPMNEKIKPLRKIWETVRP